MKRTVRKLLILMIIGAAGGALFRSRRRSPAAPETPSTEWPPFESRSDGAQNGHVSTDSATISVTNAGAAKTGAIGTLAAEAEETHARPVRVEDAQPEGASAEHATDWVAPVDGKCPDGYPIKANDNSHIFHVPGGRFYDRTVAERCYATTDAAERDGYRQAKA